MGRLHSAPHAAMEGLWACFTISQIEPHCCEDKEEDRRMGLKTSFGSDQEEKWDVNNE